MSHALVVGGGLIGLLTARALHAGGNEVTVLERGRVGSGASVAGGGILSPLYPWRFPDAVNALTRQSRSEWTALAGELRRRAGVDPEYRADGMIAIGDDDPAEVAAWAERYALTVQPLDATRLAEIEPVLRVPGGRAWRLPEVASLRPAAVLRGVADLLAREGVAVREQVPATSLAVAGDRAIGVETERGRIESDFVVVCAGAWSGALFAGLGAEPPGIRPIRGQMLAFRGAPGWLRHIVLRGGHYLIPRRGGEIVAGSTLEDVGFDAGATAAARAELTAAAAALLPVLADAPVADHWAGLRPGSDDGVPTIGAHPAVRGLYVSAGHFRNGIVTAPASARLLAGLVAGEPVDGLEPGRYAWPPERGAG